MIHLMNSAVMPAGNFGTYVYVPAKFEDLTSVVKGEYGPWASLIGYQQNVDLIERWTGVRPEVNRAETKFLRGDMALVMRLTRRVAVGTKGQPVSENPEDWEFAWVTFTCAT